MTEAEFSRLWALFGELFPAAVKKKGDKARSVWHKGTEPFLLSDVTAAVMDHARKNNFFPDLAEITSRLDPDQEWKYCRQFGEPGIIHNARVYAKIRGIDFPACDSSERAMEWFHRMEEATT